MALNRIIPFSPWILLGLVLGVCLFMSISSPVLALDSNSPLFQQDKNTTDDKAASSAPLALPQETPNPSPGIFSTLIRLLLALGLTIGLIIATVWGLKLVWEKKGWNAIGEGNKPIRILTSAFLAPRKTIHLVEIGKRILVVGVGNDEVSCLDVITNPDEVELLRNSTQQGFPKVFNRVLQKHEVVQQEAETQKIVEESNELVGGYVEKLKKISRHKKNNSGPSGGNL